MTEPNTELTFGWLRACDEAMINLHIGVANLSDSYESAKAKLQSLIDLHITIATDPAVNGGYKLVPVEPTQSVCSLWLIRKVPNTKDSYYVAEGIPPDNVLEVYGITQRVPLRECHYESPTLRVCNKCGQRHDKAVFASQGGNNAS